MPQPTTNAESTQVKSAQAKSAQPKPPARQRIIDAGRRLFYSRGFAAVTTDVLAREAGVSKSTLYGQFDNLTNVLAAVLRGDCNQFEHGIDHDFRDRTEFRAALQTFGMNLLCFLNTADPIRFTQLIYEEARDNPGIAQEFYDQAYQQTVDRLANLIAKGMAEGHLANLPSGVGPGEAAEMFVGMLRGIQFDRAHLGLTDRPFSDPQGWSGKCVELLMDSQ